MAIKASSAKTVDSLVADLIGSSDVKREAAIARLAVIGARAVDRLVSLAASRADGSARAAALRALEGIGDRRALDVALAAMADESAAVAVAAVALSRGFIRQEKGTAIVERLTATAIDRARPERVRVAAIQVLKDLEPATVAPLMRSLAGDPNSVVRAEAEPRRDHGREDQRDDRRGRATIEGVASLGLPDEAGALRELLAQEGSTAPLPALLRVVERLREKEASEAEPARAGWTTARALTHLALARRGSRVALFDLRESFEETEGPLPVDALAALALIGNTSCLEAIVRSYVRSNDAWWSDRLADAFRTIVIRERLTRRHAAVKRIEKRWKAAVGMLWPS